MGSRWLRNGVYFTSLGKASSWIPFLRYVTYTRFQRNLKPYKPLKSLRPMKPINSCSMSPAAPHRLPLQFHPSARGNRRASWEKEPSNSNIAALITRIGFWGPVYYKYIIRSPKIVQVIIEEPKLGPNTNLRVLSLEVAVWGLRLGRKGFCRSHWAR